MSTSSGLSICMAYSRTAEPTAAGLPVARRDTCRMATAQRTCGPSSCCRPRLAITLVCCGASRLCFSAKAAKRPCAVSASISPRSAALQALSAIACAASLNEAGHSAKCRYASITVCTSAGNPRPTRTTSGCSNISDFTTPSSQLAMLMGATTLAPISRVSIRPPSALRLVPAQLFVGEPSLSRSRSSAASGPPGFHA